MINHAARVVYGERTMKEANTAAVSSGAETEDSTSTVGFNYYSWSWVRTKNSAGRAEFLVSKCSASRGFGKSKRKPLMQLFFSLKY